MEEYEYLSGFTVPAYKYVEGWVHEKCWVDSIHLYLVITDEMDEETNKIDGKNWWMIEPMKPKGVTVTEKNYNDVVKWFVTETCVEEDCKKEWDFVEHKVKD